MAYIYCITNQINHKKYIGKTTNSVQERFKQHCRDSKKVRCNKRPYFWGGREAAKWLVEQGLAKSINSKRHIIDCCNNKCPHAYHYIWKYGEIPSL